MIGEVPTSREGIAIERTGAPDRCRQIGRLTLERLEQETTVGAEKFSIGFANGLPTLLG
jgi:hypothetical protein